MSSEMWRPHHNDGAAEGSVSVYSSGLLYLPAEIRQSVFDGTVRVEIEYSETGKKIRISPAPDEQKYYKISAPGMVSVFGVLNRIGVGVPNDRIGAPYEVVDEGVVVDFSDLNGGAA